MAITVAPAPGTTVDYHGSLRDYHGPCIFDTVCGTCVRCWGGHTRLRLTHIETGENLSCVSLDSVSLPVPAPQETPK
jgi:hypothetical protein